MDYKETIDMLRKQEFDLLIVCQSLDTEERQGVLATAHEVRPAMKTLIMALSDDEPMRTVAMREQIFEVLDGPETLLAVVDRMLNNAEPVSGR
jgi:DNA-binding NtrC family response regulator